MRPSNVRIQTNDPEARDASIVTREKPSKVDISDEDVVRIAETVIAMLEERGLIPKPQQEAAPDDYFPVRGQRERERVQRL